MDTGGQPEQSIANRNKRHWTQAETFTFLEAYKNRRDEFKASRKTSSAYRNVIMDLEDAGSLNRHITPVIMSSKMKSLIFQYSAYKSTNPKPPHTDFPYYELMFELFGHLDDPKKHTDVNDKQSHSKIWSDVEIVGFLRAYSARRLEFGVHCNKTSGFRNVLRDMKAAKIVKAHTNVEMLRMKMTELQDRYADYLAAGPVGPHKKFPYYHWMKNIFGDEIVTIKCGDVKSKPHLNHNCDWQNTDMLGDHMLDPLDAFADALPCSTDASSAAPITVASEQTPKRSQMTRSDYYERKLKISQRKLDLLVTIEQSKRQRHVAVEQAKAKRHKQIMDFWAEIFGVDF